jgi:hypothetical protein
MVTEARIEVIFVGAKSVRPELRTIEFALFVRVCLSIHWQRDTADVIRFPVLKLKFQSRRCGVIDHDRALS